MLIILNYCLWLTGVTGVYHFNADSARKVVIICHHHSTLNYLVVNGDGNYGNNNGGILVLRRGVLSKLFNKSSI